MDKERLYEENLSLKMRINSLFDENKKLKTRANQLEKDVNKREDLIDEIRTIGGDRNIVSPPLRNLHMVNNLKI
jgi:hypothetical protein